MTRQRPILRYHGGKWILAPWIISHFEEHKVYVEPYGGAGSVLLRKERSYAEVYNDLDDEVVNLFKVTRDSGIELKRRLEMTPFSRGEFVESYQPTKDPIERARKMIIRSFMGFGSASATSLNFGPKSRGFRVKGGNTAIYKPTTGFRANSNNSGTTPAHDWANYPYAFDTIIERLKGVVIENKASNEVAKQHDGPNTTHYWDPPYVLNTRYKKEKTSCYKFEMTDEQHEEMCNVALTLEGQVIISGYDNEIYNDILRDWHQVTKEAYADGAKPRIEKLWINRLPEKKKPKPNLFTKTDK